MYMDARDDECFRKSYCDWTLCDPLWESSVGGTVVCFFFKLIKSEITPSVCQTAMKLSISINSVNRREKHVLNATVMGRK